MIVPTKRIEGVEFLTGTARPTVRTLLPNPPGTKCLSIFARHIDLASSSLQVGCGSFLVGHAFPYTARTSKGALLARPEQRKPPASLTTASFLPGEGTPAGVKRVRGVRQVARI